MKLGSKNAILTSSDFWLGVGIIAFAVALLLKTNSERQEIMLMPRIVFCLMGICGFLLVLFKPSSFPLNKIGFNKKELGFSLVFTVSVLAIPLLGFYSILFLLSLILTQVRQKSQRSGSLLQAVIYSLLLSITLYFIFTFALAVRLPRGLLI